MKRSFNSFFIIIIVKEKKGLKFGSESRGLGMEPLIAVLCDVYFWPSLYFLINSKSLRSFSLPNFVFHSITYFSCT